VAAGLPLDFAPCGDSETAEEHAARAARASAFISIVHPAWSLLNLADGKAMFCSPVNPISIPGGTSRTVAQSGMAITDATLILSTLDAYWTGRTGPPEKQTESTGWDKACCDRWGRKKGLDQPHMARTPIEPLAKIA
jgi:hypothetical protein